MTAQPQTIAIAGAGIGGLAAALALSRRGVESRIFERRADASEAGAGIQLGPNATHVLGHLGILESVRAFASEPDALSVHDADSGRLLARMPLGAWMRERHGAPYLTLHRQDLHRALSSAAKDDPRIAIAYGSDVTGFENSTGAVEVETADGQTHSASALIAADGLWSKLRPLVTPCSAPVPAGKCAYRTVLPRAALPKSIAANDVHIWLSPGAHVVAYPVRQGSEFAMVLVIDGAASQDAWNSPASMQTIAVSPVAYFTGAVQDLMFATHAWRMWPLQKLAPLQRWTEGAVALLGDAAHPLLPFFAQGGALALEDAAVAAMHIASKREGDGRPMARRLIAYEIDRRPRAARVVDASRKNGAIYHMTGVSAAARNAVLATIPPAMLMRRYDWLYGWKP